MIDALFHGLRNVAVIEMMKQIKLINSIINNNNNNNNNNNTSSVDSGEESETDSTILRKFDVPLGASGEANFDALLEATLREKHVPLPVVAPLPLEMLSMAPLLQNRTPPPSPLPSPLPVSLRPNSSKNNDNNNNNSPNNDDDLNYLLMAFSGDPSSTSTEMEDTNIDELIEQLS